MSDTTNATQKTGKSAVLLGGVPLSEAVKDGHSAHLTNKPFSDHVRALEQIDTIDAAKVIGMSASWLEHDRQKPRPEIPFVRMGSRAVRYRVTDLLAYAERQLVAA